MTAALAVHHHLAALLWIAVQPWHAGAPGAALQGLYQGLSPHQPPGQQAAILPAAALLGALLPSRSSTGFQLGRSQEPGLCMRGMQVRPNKVGGSFLLVYEQCCWGSLTGLERRAVYRCAEVCKGRLENAEEFSNEYCYATRTQ